MDERDNLAVQDVEFAKLLRDGLNSSFADEGICVTEDLIARTMKAIEADAAKTVTGRAGVQTESTAEAVQNSTDDAGVRAAGAAQADANDTEVQPVRNTKDIQSSTSSAEVKNTETAPAGDNIIDIKAERNKKLRRFSKIAAGVAAAAFIGVVGISVILRGGMRMKSTKPENATMFASDTAMSFKADSEPADTASSSEEAIMQAATGNYSASDIYAEADYSNESEVCDEAVYDNEGALKMADDSMADGAETGRTAESFGVAANGAADAYGEPAIWYVGATEINYYSAGNFYSFSGDEAADLYQSLLKVAQSSCKDAVYDITGFVTAENGDIVPDDMGDCLLTVSYIGDGVCFMGTINVYNGYCDIHDDKPLSSSSNDYNSVLYRIDDGAGLAAKLKEMLEPKE